VLPVFVLVLPGLIAFALYPQLFHVVGGKVTNGDIAYPTMIVNLLPSGLVGLMIAALLAALMGAMSSVFNSASTMVTLDFYKKFRPAATEKQLVFFGRGCHGRHGAFGPIVGAVYQVSQPTALYLSAERAGVHQSAIAVCFIFGILWPRLNGQGAISSLLTGFVLGAVRFVFEVLDKSRHYDSRAIRWLVDMNFLHYAIVMSSSAPVCSSASA